jgi:hypothetical protein
VNKIIESKTEKKKSIKNTEKKLTQPELLDQTATWDMRSE